MLGMHSQVCKGQIRPLRVKHSFLTQGLQTVWSLTHQFVVKSAEYLKFLLLPLYNLETSL